jgi:Dynein light chain type 1
MAPTLASRFISAPPNHSLLQKAAQAIKEAMDRKFGPNWHAIVGEGFGFNVTFNKHQMQYIYYGEKLGIVVFKC